MNKYNQLIRFYKLELEDFTQWIETNRAAGKSMSIGKNVNDLKAFKRVFTKYTCGRFNLQLVPAGMLPDILEQNGLPQQWRELVWLSLVDLAQADFNNKSL